MKNSILLATFLIGSFLGTSVYADDLKRSCVKDYPLVSGETDPTLIGIFAQVCDKKNKDNKNAYLVQAAQQFQKIGQNFKALQIVNDLNAQNFSHSALTDVKFLAGIGIADQALSQIRNKEVRYLTDEGYDASMKLNDAVKRAKPLTVIENTTTYTPSTNNGSKVNGTKTGGSKNGSKGGGTKTGGTKTGTTRSGGNKVTTNNTSQQDKTNTNGGRKNPFTPFGQ